MAWTTKKYARINWKNRPSTATALGATNLNRMDVFLNEIDNGMIEFEASKLNVELAKKMFVSLTIDVNTGIITATQYDGTVFTWDLNLEKIPVSFSLSEDGVLTMTTEDGTEFTANIADLIKEYVFDDSDTIGFSKRFDTTDEDPKGTYHVTAVVKNGSINEEHLNPDYRSDIQRFTNTAQTAANDSLQYSKDSKRWAVGDAEYEGSNTDNSKYYKEQAEAARDQAEKYRDEANTQARTEIMAPGRVGVGMPDNISIKTEEDGTIYAVTAEKGKVGIVKSDEATIFTGENGEIKAQTNYYGSYEAFPRPPKEKEKGKIFIDETVDPRLVYTWDDEKNDYILTGGAGGADGSSIDIPVTLPAAGWTGTTGPCSQTVTVPQMREGMTPILFLTENADPDMLYAYGLIVDYTASYGQMTFYAADLPSVDISVTLKGVPAQQLEYVDNTVIVLVSASGFALNEDYGRYTQTITMDGMTAGLGGNWDIVRSGPVLTVEESEIVRNITDINRLDGAVEIVCLTPPEQDYMLYFQGTQTPVNDDTPILAGMQGWFDKTDKIEDNLGDKFSTDKVYAVDNYCIYEDELYKFTADKEAGEWDATKVKPTNVSKEFQTVNTKNESSLTVLVSGTNHNNTLERYGKMIHLNLWTSGAVTGGNVIAKIPEGYRPTKNIVLIGLGRADSGNLSSVIFNINRNGNITQSQTNGTVSDICVDVTYMTD